MFYFVSWELGYVQTFWLSAHSIFRQLSFFGWNKPEDKTQFLTVNPEYTLESFLKQLFLSHCIITYFFTSLSFPLPLLRTDWLRNSLQFAFLITFHKMRNLLCSECIWTKSVCSLFSECAHGQISLSSPLLPHWTKRKDALASWSCQEIDFSIFVSSFEPQRVHFSVCFEK